jgi:hypothetical protein
VSGFDFNGACAVKPLAAPVNVFSKEFENGRNYRKHGEGSA